MEYPGEYRHNRRTLTGAWIETGVVEIATYGALVAPSRVRGLKPVVMG